MSSSASSTALLLSEAARVITAVATNGRSLDDALASAPTNEAPSRPALQALAYGTLRHYHRLDFWLNSLLERPADLRQPDIKSLLAVGLHQLAYSSHPPHAIVHE